MVKYKNMYTINDLDKRFCDIEGCQNTETIREFIIHAEQYLYLEPTSIEALTDETLTEHIDWLDHLLSK